MDVPLLEPENQVLIKKRANVTARFHRIPRPFTALAAFHKLIATNARTDGISASLKPETAAAGQINTLMDPDGQSRVSKDALSRQPPPPVAEKHLGKNERVDEVIDLCVADSVVGRMSQSPASGTRWGSGWGVGGGSKRHNIAKSCDEKDKRATSGIV